VATAFLAKRTNTEDAMQQSAEEGSHPFCRLPGDPSLILTTNVDLGGKKMDVMKGKGGWLWCAAARELFF